MAEDVREDELDDGGVDFDRSDVDRSPAWRRALS